MSWVTKWLSDIISGKYLKGSYARAKKKSQKNNAAKTVKKGSPSKKGQKKGSVLLQGITFVNTKNHPSTFTSYNPSTIFGTNTTQTVDGVSQRYVITPKHNYFVIDKNGKKRQISFNNRTRVNSVTINQQKLTLGKGTKVYDEQGGVGVINGDGTITSGGGVGVAASNDSGGGTTSSLGTKELEELEAMTDSNVIIDGKNKKRKANDIWNKAASKKMKSYWQLSETVFLYTFHDKQKHKYLTSFQIDSDKNDICTTCTISFPYSNDLMEYWVPGQTTFALIGGVYDREVLFIGRCSEVNQSGTSIEMVGQNVGWKFKQYMKSSFYDKLKGLNVKNAVKLIFKELGFDKAFYHINLSGIPNIDSYILDEQCSIKKDGNTVENVPDLESVVDNLKGSNIKDYVANKMEMLDTQTVADKYETKKQMRNLNSVVKNKNEYYVSGLRENYGVEARVVDGVVDFDPIVSNFFEEGEEDDWFINGASYDGDYTYEDVLHSIASAIDAHFYIIDTTVCFVSFNALFAMSDTVTVQKAIAPKIDFWQLEEDSYVLDVNQYGYYNTVTVNYKNGSVTKAYDDLVRIYGEVPIEYDEPELSYSEAMLKAQAYLSAHIRDFGMTIQATILYTGKIVPSTFIKLKNPLTMSDNLFYVYGMSVSWSADGGSIIGDLDLRFGPENPDDPEVPEVGMGYAQTGGVFGGNVSADIAQAAQQMCMGATDPTIKGQNIYNWVDANIPYNYYTNSAHSTSATLQGTPSNCWDTAMLIYELCTAAGVRCEVWNGNYRFRSGSVIGHLWNMIEQNGQMVFADTGFGRSGTITRNPIGDYHGGGIVSGRCIKKNY